MDDEQFLRFIAEYVRLNPKIAARVVEAAQFGINAALQEANERAADMETALTVALAKRYKNADTIIHEKLLKWDGKTALNWTAVIGRIDK